jgi:hypothetical protein
MAPPRRRTYFEQGPHCLLIAGAATGPLCGVLLVAVFCCRTDRAGLSGPRLAASLAPHASECLMAYKAKIARSTTRMKEAAN